MVKFDDGDNLAITFNGYEYGREWRFQDEDEDEDS